MITRALIKNSIWEKLNKSPTTKGFYTDSKVNLAVQESLDRVAVEMFLADEGWARKIIFLNTTANQVSIPIPADIAMISQVRHLLGNVFIPLIYDQENDQPMWSATSGAAQFPSRYRVIDNNLYFNPAIGVGGPNFLEIEYMAYPIRLRNDEQFLESQFDWCMFHYVVYRSCSILAGNIGQFSKPWKEEELDWQDKMVQIVNKRNLAPTPIRDFSGY